MTLFGAWSSQSPTGELNWGVNRYACRQNGRTNTIYNNTSILIKAVLHRAAVTVVFYELIVTFCTTYYKLLLVLFTTLVTSFHIYSVNKTT